MQVLESLWTVSSCSTLVNRSSFWRDFFIFLEEEEVEWDGYWELWLYAGGVWTVRFRRRSPPVGPVGVAGVGEYGCSHSIMSCLMCSAVVLMYYVVASG